MKITSATHVAPPFIVPPSMSADSIRQLADKLSAPMADQMAHGTVRVPFCRVIGVLTPTKASEINFEAWLPEAHYNGRLVQEGDGGLLGAIPYTLMSKLINRGFAVMGSDKGHHGDSMDYKWAIDQPEKVIDHHYRATHATTVATKALVAKFYGDPARHTYFSGCSGGAVQGFEAAMYNPEDFDGMAIGGAAPPVANPRLPAIGELPKILAESKGLDSAKLQLVSRAAIASCDQIDGVRDGVISYPKQCRFDPGTLACRTGVGSDCLTDLEVVAIKRGYALGMSPGTEYYWRFLEKLGFPPEAGKYIALAPPANETYLQSFEANGRKMIAYVGTVDVSAPGFEKYQEALVARDRDSGLSPEAAEEKVGRFYRAFELPAMEHCMGGPGPNNISASLQPERDNANADEDIMAALISWVEQGRAPEYLIATKYEDDNPSKPVSMTRPICVYPKLAQWDRKGSPSHYRSFSCVNPPAH
ncbi:MAG TPA: tannase/feruloyl esterase family alpha/beta hydrolase [Steroidobacteraceae bacterium]|nr:tannase/feruloyl esterase family alpha/beta hydrolase [Steroidobacteraceae bacterium]